MEELIRIIRERHEITIARSAAAAEMDRFESTSGQILPSDVRSFYSRIEQALLFDGELILLPPREWVRTGAALLGPEWKDSGPVSWYAFCDARDGDHIGIDLRRREGGSYFILDCNHDDTFQTRVIAGSFTGFLQSVLTYEGGKYYLDGNFRPVTTLMEKYREPDSYVRRTDGAWYERLGPELGPDKCRIAECGRLRIKQSVFCRRHHYASVRGRPWPFED